MYFMHSSISHPASRIQLQFSSVPFKTVSQILGKDMHSAPSEVSLKLELDYECCE